jgi:hypothetical protein
MGIIDVNSRTFVKQKAKPQNGLFLLIINIVRNAKNLNDFYQTVLRAPPSTARLEPVI